jgi:hypothetical protein
LWDFDNVVTFSESHSLARAGAIQYEQLLHFPELVPGDTNAQVLMVDNNQLSEPLPVSNTIKKIYVYDRANAYEILSRTPMAYMLTSPIPEDVLLPYRLTQRCCQVPHNTYKDVLIAPQGYRQTEMEALFLDCVAKARDELKKRIKMLVRENH